MVLSWSNAQVSPKRLATPAVWLTLFFALAGLACIAMLSRDFLSGGNAWRQGDWLINREMVDARRGLLGSLLLAVSDRLSISPLLATIGLQAGLSLATIYLTWRACLLQGVTVKLLLLVASSGFFLMLWLNDGQAAFRKEIVVFLAMAMLSHAASRDRLSTGVAVASMLTFAASIAAHEGMIFFLPVYLAALYAAWKRPVRLAHWLSVAAFLAVVLALFANNATRPSLVSADPVCAPLLARGLGPDLCMGAIDALTSSLAEEMAKRPAHAPTVSLAFLAFAYGLAILPAAVFFRDGTRRGRMLIAAFLLSGFAFLPLFPVAIDWGRWITFHISSAVYLVLILRGRGLLRESTLPNPPFLATATLALLPTVVAYNHVWAEPRLGLAVNVARKILGSF